MDAPTEKLQDIEFDVVIERYFEFDSEMPDPTGGGVAKNRETGRPEIKSGASPMSM